MAEEWDVELGAKLKSNAASSLNKDIDNLVKSNKVKDIKIKIVPDDTELKKKISEIEKRIASINKQSINANIGNNSTKQVSDINKAYKELLNTAKQINKTRVKIEGLDSTRNINEIKALEAELDNLRKSFDKQKGAFNFSPEQLQTVQNELNEIDEKLNQIQKKKLDKIQLKFDDGGSAQKALDSMSQKFKKLGADNQEANEKLEKLRSLMNQIKTSDNIDDVERDYKDFQGTLQDLVEQYNRLSQAATASSQSQKNAVDASKLERDKAEFSLQIDSYIAKNQRAVEQFGGQLREVQAQIKGADNIELNNLKRQFAEVQARVKEAGLEGQTFGQKLSAQLEKLNIYFSASAIIMRTIQTIRQAITTVEGLDTALVDLRKTTNASRQELEEFYYSSNDTAKELGVTTQAVIQAAADWSRLGYNIKDAQEMAKTSSIFSSISPDLDINEATDGLVSAMKAFKIEADDALDGVASKINIIGNTQAVSNGNIVDFLTRSSSAMAEANNTLDETIALGTAITEITRDAANAGQVMKTASMRIRGYDEETEQLSDDVLELTGKIADLTKTASNPSGISLFTDSAKTQYKSTVQILREISGIYDELTDKQQAQLLELLGGKRGGQAIAAALKNWDAVENSLTSMQNSAGNAMQEMSIIEESLEFKLNALKETAVGVFQNLLSQKDFSTVLEFLTGVLKGVDSVTDSLGLLNTAVITISGSLSLFKNVGRDKMFSLKYEYANINNSSA